MTAMHKTPSVAQTKVRTMVSRQGTVVSARYSTQKQAETAARVLQDRREALLYLSKR